MSFIVYLKGKEEGVHVDADKEVWSVAKVRGLSHTAVSVLRFLKDGKTVAEFVREDVFGWQKTADDAHDGPRVTAKEASTR